MRYGYHVAYSFDGAIASATFWLESEEVSSTKDVMEFQKQIRLTNGLRPDSPVAVLSWQRLPGDDQESRPSDTNVRTFKPRG